MSECQCVMCRISELIRRSGRAVAGTWWQREQEDSADASSDVGEQAAAKLSEGNLSERRSAAG